MFELPAHAFYDAGNAEDAGAVTTANPFEAEEDVVENTQSVDEENTAGDKQEGGQLE